jgi:hypothetical protein
MLLDVPLQEGAIQRGYRAQRFKVLRPERYGVHEIWINYLGTPLSEEAESAINIRLYQVADEVTEIIKKYEK